MGDDPPEWDVGLAEALLGSTVLVGITYEAPAGPRLEQFFGQVRARTGNMESS